MKNFLNYDLSDIDQLRYTERSKSREEKGEGRGGGGGEAAV